LAAAWQRRVEMRDVLLLGGLKLAPRPGIFQSFFVEAVTPVLHAANSHPDKAHYISHALPSQTILISEWHN